MRRAWLAAGLTAAFLTGGPLPADAQGSAPARLSQSLDADWRFHRVDGPEPQEAFGDRSFDDASWEVVRIPHSVRLEPQNASGMRNFQGISWYRRHFRVEEAWKNRKVLVRFEGAMQVADLWVNGRHLTTHFGGYTPFTVDLSGLVEYGGADNVLALRLDNTDHPDVPPGKPQKDLDFVYFGGLYRSVHLVVTDRLHVTDAVQAGRVASGGLFVTYPVVSKEAATVRVQVHLRNDHATSRRATMVASLLDGERTVARSSRSQAVGAGAEATLLGLLPVADPRLWHPYHPHLYDLRVQVLDGSRVADEVTTRIGIRSIRYDTGGLWINGERLIAAGANRHQDYPYVGYAIPDAVQYRDVKRLRDAGCLSLRTHYPWAPATLAAADELGMLVIVANPGWQWFRPGVFVERAYQGVRDMVRRDRNHPSVVLWEPILNETHYPEDFARAVHGIVHEEFPGDQAYAVADLHLPGGKNFDVVYAREKVEGKPTWVREWGDEVDNWTDQNAPNRVSRRWGEAALLRQARSQASGMARQFAIPGIAGFGVWAGIDTQRGYHLLPFLGGFLDLFRIPKFSYHLFASQRPPDVRVAGLNDGPMVHVASYWNQFSPGDVTVFSNCERVRLFQDGTLVAEQGPDESPALPHPPFTFAALRPSLGRYEPGDGGGNGDESARRWIPGELRAEGLVGGKVVATHVVRTAGVPTQLGLEIDDAGLSLVADGSDFVLARALVRDARGTTAPLAEDLVSFAVTGEGALIGDASIGANPMTAEAGIASALVRATRRAGKITVTAQAFGLTPATLTFESRPHPAPER